jgi:phenylacetate-coenzyme A ligase PaaK-like adenylate-forming protein
MSFLADLKPYARFAAGLPGFLRNPISLDDARAIIQHRLERREQNFLKLLEKAVFGYQKSPYRELLKLAGCEMGDLRNAVQSDGIEKTLETLRSNGVYISFEEFKGRTPIIRDGGVIGTGPRCFANPYLSKSFQHETGGSTGAGTRVETDLDHIAAQAPHLMLAREMHGVLDAPTALWRGVLPDGSGIHNILRACRFGRVPQKWFSPVTRDKTKPALKYEMATYGTVIIGRLSGVKIPWPETITIDNAIVVARWAADNINSHGSCVVMSPVSRALRICLEAERAGLGLEGATFIIAGEPPTPAKVKGITRTGARCFPTYGLAESGRMGMGCGQPIGTNDLHLLTDAFALIQHPRAVPGWDVEVDAFNVTSLLLTTPLILLNVEIDDYGILERRSCGCAFQGYGFEQHVRDVRSFRKLTGEGVTLVGSEMMRILEEVLPSRFGGSSLDYQLLEEEDEQGFTRLSLVVSPRLVIEDEQQVIETVLEAMSRSSVGADSARDIWGQAGTLRVKRAEPIWTSRGKLMPLHLMRKDVVKSES